MAINLISLAEALKQPLDTTVSITAKLLDIGDMQQNTTKDNKIRRYRVLRIADTSENLHIRSYNMKEFLLFEAGKFYLFQNLVRKAGEHCFWAVSSTKGCEWAPFEIPDKILSSTIKTSVQTTTLEEALISKATSDVTAKILQVPH